MSVCIAAITAVRVATAAINFSFVQTRDLALGSSQNSSLLLSTLETTSNWISSLKART
jgi:hypothetical protein